MIDVPIVLNFVLKISREILKLILGDKMKVLCVLYDDPKGGMPKSYALSDLPKLEKYPDGMTLPSPKVEILHQENY